MVGIGNRSVNRRLGLRAAPPTRSQPSSPRLASRSPCGRDRATAGHVALVRVRQAGELVWTCNLSRLGPRRAAIRRRHEADVELAGRLVAIRARVEIVGEGEMRISAGCPRLDIQPREEVVGPARRRRESAAARHNPLVFRVSSPLTNHPGSSSAFAATRSPVSKPSVNQA